MPVISFLCVPQTAPDPETGCRFCGSNAKTDYEQCRQTFFLKQQNQILQSQSATNRTTQSLNTEKQQLQGLLDSQQKQVKELIQQVDSQNQRINILNTSLKNSNILSIGLVAITGILVICLILIFIKKVWKR
jgi:hypothetical protein